MLSPYHESPGFGIQNGIPRDCELSQAHILHRHAERYPESDWFDGGGMESFSDKLNKYIQNHGEVGTGLAFLRDWRYLLGRDVLLPSGAATEMSSGADIWSSYGRMLYRAPASQSGWEPGLNKYPNGTERSKPVFRTTDKQRVRVSAEWWLNGFFGLGSGNDDYELVVIPEGGGLNNTLAAEHSCPGDLKEETEDAARFLQKVTAKALPRLSRHLPDFSLTSPDILAMMNLCPYETAALGRSSFCDLFTEQEWLDYAYHLDMRLYGASGFGSPTGRAQGIGYVLELAARLEGKLPSLGDTSINTTYDTDPARFPIHQPLYMDMTHDKIIIGTLAALGLQYFNYGPKGLPVDVGHAVPRTFHLNRITPFGAHLVSEVWTCPGNADLNVLDKMLYTNPDLSNSNNTTEYIRFVLNGAPVPMTGLVGCEHAVNGFCNVSDFVNAVPILKTEAMYQEACYGNYTPGHQVGNGQPE
ncbi:histidine phosphatase superfamily [Aspergillus avenaceus]|uniref:Histidine phosphatase superfamily n=1 Tax=Aspergillus avenaceus TaxID=36643 RepID=A0A5N6U3J0_ASPAV|nr:histidine phosphatase superfamily [Aspergillus avenaceus]